MNIFKVEDIHKSSLLILGDSRFESVNTNLKNAINLSVGGETSNTLFKRIQNYNFRDSIKIIIGIGLNDALFSYSSSLALYNMNRLLTKIFKKTNNSKIYICEILPINSDGFFYKKEPINLLLNKMNLLIDTINLDFNNNYKEVIYFKNLRDENNHLNLNYSYDGIHLNENGLNLFNHSINQFLKDEEK